mmetsp:Transcript_1211/g.747  ORF Transcript_1211/g.747 Transcript_1211/m.747 type:complete len:117 (-) Transcript_1211:746-1096(-)
MKRNGREIFLKHEEVVASFEDKKLAPGHHNFPFKFTIPDWVPSSFIYCGEQKSKIRIYYTVKAFVKPVGAELKNEEEQKGEELKKMEVPSLKGKRRILVAQPKNEIVLNHNVDVGH